MFAFLALIVLAAAGPRDVAGALSRLSAAGAGERFAAERELAQILVSADAPLLVAAARSGSAEVRSRIAAALTSRARHFALAAELAASDDSGVAGTGAEALAGQAAVWLGTSDQEPLPIGSVQREIGEAFSGIWQLDVRRGELEQTLDRIARLVDARRIDRAGAPVPALVLDPRFDAGAKRELAAAEDLPSPVVGRFGDLVSAAAVSHGAVFDVYGWNEGRSWFLVRAAGSTSPRPAQAVLRGWILAVQKPASARSARAAARALAGSGWPAAIEWLEVRWRKHQDPAALDALVLAASRGALADSLATRAGAELLLERADRLLRDSPEDRPEARELARALLTIGNLGREAWAGGFANAASRGKYLRCALVAGARSCPPELRMLLEARWLAAETGTQERCALLRALASLGGSHVKDVAVPGLEAAFEWAVDHGAGRAFPLALRTLGAREPAAWKTGHGLRPQLQVELCADSLANGTDPADPLAGARIATLIAQEHGEELALELFDRESLWLSRARLRAGLLAARAAGAAPDTIARLLICTDSATAEEARESADAVFARKEWTAADWRAAGAAVAGAGGELDSWPRTESKDDEHYANFLERLELVRNQLLPAQRAADSAAKPAAFPAQLQGMEAGWVQGCSRTIARLRMRQAEPGAREFLRRLRVIFQRVQHPFRRELIDRRFPRLPASIQVDVEQREPWLGF